MLRRTKRHVLEVLTRISYWRSGAIGTLGGVARVTLGRSISLRGSVAGCVTLERVWRRCLCVNGGKSLPAFPSLDDEGRKATHKSDEEHQRGSDGDVPDERLSLWGYELPIQTDG